MDFLQFNNLLFNCETQYLKMINLELCTEIERFRKDRVYCQSFLLINPGKSRNESDAKIPVETSN